jgi:hypothetical protein
MITMLLGGLWHGAGAAYVLWGFYHGMLLAIQRAWYDLTGRDGRLGRENEAPGGAEVRGIKGRVRGWFLTVFFFHLTCIGWLLFRAGGMPHKFGQVQTVLGYLRAMFHWPTGGVTALAPTVLLLGALALFFQWQHEKMDHFSTWKMHWQAVATALALAAIVGLGVFNGAQFIYFQF